MPYISENNRGRLDHSIHEMVESIKHNVSPNENNPYGNPYKDLSNEEFLSIVGDINYCFSRVLASLMGKVSYSKIAMITGVLNNISQEYYRRVASVYEDQKIISNGDIPEYRKLS